MTYEAYAARAPAGKLDLVLDADGVELHLRKIADATDDWETVLAPHMGLTRMEVMDIRKNHRDDRALQRREFLWLWKTKFGDRATYGNLMRICLDHGYRGCATVISNLWSTTDCEVDASAMKLDNIGMILQLRQDNLQYRALKKYEDELIESLHNVDILALAKSAVKCSLVPKELVSHIQHLDPNVQWPHPLICRFLFYPVYAAIQSPSPVVAEPFEQWLRLLSDLKIPMVVGVLSRVKQCLFSMKSMIASRASKEGDVLKLNDVPLLTRVLADFPSHSRLSSKTSLREMVYSLELSNSELEWIQTVTGSIELRLTRVLTMWAQRSQTTATKLLTIENVEKVLRSNIVGLAEEAGKLRGKFQSLNIILQDDQLDEGVIPLLSQFLNKCASKWKEIAYSVFLLDSEIKQLMCMEPYIECLEKVLTKWVRREFPNARLPTLENLLKVLNDNNAAQLRRNLVNEGTKLSKDSCFEEGEGDLKIRMVGPQSELTIAEGCSALLEVQLKVKEPVDYEWLLDEKVVDAFCVRNAHGYFSGTILCVGVKDLTFEGSYTCKIKQYDKSVVSQAILLSVDTPLDVYRSTLVTFFTEQPEVSQDVWPPVSSRSYISLALIKQGIIGAGEFSRNTIRGDVDDVYSNKESIVYEKAFNRLDNGVRFLVEGRPGSGKTTLVHKVSRDWGTGKLLFLHNRLLLFAHLRAFSSDPNVGLRDIIKCFYNADSTIAVITEYAEKHNGLGLCFILDGLDEYVPRKSNCFIFRLIRKEVLLKAAVIVASRPAAAASFRAIATTQVEVIGFLKEHIYDYITKYPFSKMSKCDELCKYFDQHPSVVQTCYLPIHSAMICFLFDNLETALPQTETEIYKEFTKHTILRTLYREEQYEEYIESIDNLDTPQKNLYENICKLAYEMTVISKQAMKQADIRAFFDMKSEKDCLGLVTVDRIATLLGFQKLYTFLHLTYQEFLAACYISNSEEMKQMELILKYGKELHMQQVWKFFCGLAKFSDNSKFETLVGHVECGSLFKAQCCFESQQPHLCDAAVVKNSLSFADTFLSTSNFTEIAYVISNTQQNPVQQLSFEGCIFGEEGVDVLVKKAEAKLILITTLCYYKCNTERLAMVKYLAHILPSLKTLDISDFQLASQSVESLFHSSCSLEMVTVGSQGVKLFSTNNSHFKFLLAKESSDHIYHVFSCGFADFMAEESRPVKAVSRELIFYPGEYEEVRQLYVDYKNTISVDSQWPFSELLLNCHNLLTLDFSANSLGEGGATILAEALQNCTKLVKLDVSSNNLGCEGARAIADGLQHCIYLLELNINSNYIGSDGARALAEALKNSATFQELKISSNNIKCKGVKALANSIKHWPRLFSLDVSSNCIQGEGVKALADALEKIPSFHELYIEKNMIEDDGMKYLAKISTSLFALNISSNHISLSAVADTLKNIRKLSISDNYVRSLDPKFATVVRSNSACLCELDISNTSLSANSLKLCVHLQNLNVSNNRLGAACIMDCLENLTELCVFSAGFNHIGSEGAKALASGLIHCVNLCKLHINNNRIGDDGASAVADIIKHCRKLQVLNVASNNIYSDGAESLADAIQRDGNGIQSLDISGNDIRGNKVFLALEHCVAIYDLNFSYIGGLSHLAESLKSYTSLQKLKISGKKVDKRLIEGLKFCRNLQELSIEPCSYGVKVLAYGLSRYCRRLTVLDIVMTYSEEIVDLAGVLKHCSCLQCLNISSDIDTFSRYGYATFGNYLRHCAKLHSLDISGNNLMDAGVEVLCEGLRHCKTLAHLYISHNNFFAQGVKALANVLEHCSLLRTLDLSHNSVRDEGAVQLAKALQHNTTLCELRISKCEIGHHGATTLAKTLQHCTGLSSLDISDNLIDAEAMKKCFSHIQNILINF